MNMLLSSDRVLSKFGSHLFQIVSKLRQNAFGTFRIFQKIRQKSDFVEKSVENPFFCGLRGMKNLREGINSDGVICAEKFAISVANSFYIWYTDAIEFSSFVKQEVKKWISIKTDRK